MQRRGTLLVAAFRRLHLKRSAWREEDSAPEHEHGRSEPFQGGANCVQRADVKCPEDLRTLHRGEIFRHADHRAYGIDPVSEDRAHEQKVSLMERSDTRGHGGGGTRLEVREQRLHLSDSRPSSRQAMPKRAQT